MDKVMKEIYKNELLKYMKEKEAKHYVDTDEVFKIGDMFVVFDKPSIQTSFCYGYGFNGVSTMEDMEDAYNCADAVQTREDVFIEQNLKKIDDKIEAYKECLNDLKLNWHEGNHPIYMIGFYKNYYGENFYSAAIYNTYEERLGQTERYATPDELEQIINALEQIKVDFTKRLKTYLKRYGLSKLNVWTYLSD